MAADGFVGRKEDLRRFAAHLDAVRSDGRGRMLVVRGRRQVGKSRLLTQAVEKAGVPAVYVTGSLQATVKEDLDRFRGEVARSNLPRKDFVTAGSPADWDAALRLLAGALPADEPSVVVLDEFPWLLQRDPGLEGTLQVVWDRLLEGLPVLLVLVGSDLSVMQSLSEYGRPLFGRAKIQVVKPFHPGDTAAVLGLSGADAIDAQLVTGGYPRLLVEARRHDDLAAFVRSQLGDEYSDLVQTASRVMAAEFPTATQASLVLRSIGSGEREFRNIRQAAGVSDQALHAALGVLADKGVVARDMPVGMPQQRQPRYRVDDSYLRCWLALIAPNVAAIERGRPDIARQGFRSGFTSWRGRAVEPLVRDALTLLAADDPRLHGAGAVGGWWPRSNDPEIDLVGADRLEEPSRLLFAGSVKWREDRPFGVTDTRRLIADLTRSALPDALPLVAVARSKVSDPSVVGYTANDLLSAWA
jgi:uncharacterized protein